MHAPRVHDSNDAPELAIRRGEYSALAGPNMVNIHAPFGDSLVIAQRVTMESPNDTRSNTYAVQARGFRR